MSSNSQNINPFENQQTKNDLNPFDCKLIFSF